MAVEFAAASDFDVHMVGEGVDAGYADAVETTGDLVGVLVELAACVEDRHDDFESGAVLFLVHVDRDATTIVLNGDGAVFVDSDLDMGAVSGHGLIDGVVYDLIDQVVESAFADVANVH